MASRSGRLSQDRNLGVAIDGKASFKGQKKTGGAGVRKPIGEASFRGQKKTKRAGVKKAQDGPKISGKQLKSEKLASVKEEVIPSNTKALSDIDNSGKLNTVGEIKTESSKDKNLDSKRIASEVPEKSLTSMMQALSDIANSGKLNESTWMESESALFEELWSGHSYEKCRKPLPRQKCLCEIFEIQKDGN